MAQSKLKTTKLSLFKNGTFYHRQEGNVTLKNKQAQLEIPENILLGTYWLSVGKGNKISQITFEEDTLKKRKTCENLSDVLAASKGRKITLRLNEGAKESTTLSGTLGSYNLVTGLGRLITEGGGSTFFLSGNVVGVSVGDKDLQNVYEADTIIRLARLRVANDDNEVPVSLISMQTGIQWFPSYYLKIDGEKEAKLIMKATIQNFALDIENAEADLVVGNPSSAFGQQLDPVSENYTTPDPPAPQPAYPINHPNKRVMRKAVMAIDYAAAPMPEAANYETAGDQQQDLYFYRTGKISLHKNSKTQLMISSATIPYSELFSVNVNDNVNYINTQNSQNDWTNWPCSHILKLQNKTDAPLTDAPIFVVSPTDDPLAQQNLSYTPPNAEFSVFLNNAVNVEVKSREEEKSHVNEAKRIQKAVFNKVTLKGSVKVHNYQKKAIKLEVNKQVTGEVTTSSDDGKLTLSGNYSQLNPNANIRWQLDMPAESEKTITYEYNVYIVVSQ